MVIDMIPAISYVTAHSGSFSDLRRCILSVLKDCYHSRVPFEHLVWIDGHSKDLSPEEITQRAAIQQLEKACNGSLKIYWSHYNEGKSFCVNRLLSLSQGNVVSFLDSDDWIFRGRTLQTISTFVDHNINILGTQYMTGPSNLSRVDESRYPLTDTDIRKNLIFFPYLLYSSLSISLDFIRSNNLFFDESLKAGLDIDFYYKIMRYSTVQNSKFCSVYYTRNPHGLTSTSKTRAIQLNSHLSIIRKILSEGDSGSLTSQIDYLSVKLMQKIAIDFKATCTFQPPPSLALLERNILTNWCSLNNTTSFIGRLPFEHKVDLISKLFSLAVNG